MDNEAVVLYQSSDGKITFDVTLKEDTIWLNRQQISELFERDIKTIGKHINIALKEELVDIPVVANFATTAADGKVYQTGYYNLDMIISIGYRVKSNRGIQFRRWANVILKEYLVNGYAIKEKTSASQLRELRQAVKVLTRVHHQKQLSTEEASGLLKVLEDFSYGLEILDQYDYHQLSVRFVREQESFYASYDDCMNVVRNMGEFSEASHLFGRQMDRSFKSSISTIYQTFDSKPLYPSIEEKSSLLLYLVVKNHSFVDGNKRIAAALFLWFLDKNAILYKPDGSRLIENNTLVALTLMIAESRPEEMDSMIKVIVSLINLEN